MTNQPNPIAITTTAPLAEVLDEELRLVGQVFDLGTNRAEIRWLVADPWKDRPLYLCRD